MSDLNDLTTLAEKFHYQCLVPDLCRPTFYIGKLKL